MTASRTQFAERQRAPSKRALATKARVFDAAEKVFAQMGFDGATIRDIAAEAGEPVGTIHHHGGGKDLLFRRTIARRATALSRARIDALATERRKGNPTLEAILAAFFCPFFDLASQDEKWANYARLVAIVSSDTRWASLTAEFFDETVNVFMQELHQLLPDASRHEIAANFVYSISALLALLTSRERIGAMGGGNAPRDSEIQGLLRFCAAGFAAKSINSEQS